MNAQPVPEDIDWVAVERACSGERLPLNSDEVDAAWRRLHEQGHSDGEIGVALGVSTSIARSWRVGRTSPQALNTPAQSAAAANSGDLIDEALESDSRRVRTAAVSARKAMDRLRLAVEAHAAAAGARARIADLERELAVAKAALRGSRAPAVRQQRKLRAADFPCRAGCSRVSTTSQGRAAHERHCQVVN